MKCLSLLFQNCENPRETTMAAKHSPTRALAAYYRALTQHHHGDLPLEDLPTYICEETTERDYVIVCNDARTLAVYRV